MSQPGIIQINFSQKTPNENHPTINPLKINHLPQNPMRIKLEKMRKSKHHSGIYTKKTANCQLKK